MLTISAQKRDLFGKRLKKERKDGNLPAVLYGPKEETSSITIPAQEFDNVWRKAGETTVVSLRVEGIGEKDVMIHDVAVDPVRGNPIHVDFYAIEKGKKITVEVPLVFIGVAHAVKELGGTLVKVLHEIEIEAFPKNIPHELTVDISSLSSFDSHIAVKDILLPEGVEALEKQDEIVASIASPREEEETAPVDFSQVEVEKKGKQEEAKENESEEGKSE